MNAEDEEDAAAALLGLIQPSDRSSHDGSTADRHRAPKKRKVVHGSARPPHPERDADQQQPGDDKEPEHSKPKVVKKKRKKRKIHGNVEHNYPVPPRVIQVCKVPKTHVNQ